MQSKATVSPRWIANDGRAGASRCEIQAFVTMGAAEAKSGSNKAAMTVHVLEPAGL